MAIAYKMINLYKWSVCLTSPPWVLKLFRFQTKNLHLHTHYVILGGHPTEVLGVEKGIPENDLNFEDSVDIFRSHWVATFSRLRYKGQTQQFSCKIFRLRIKTSTCNNIIEKINKYLLLLTWKCVENKLGLSFQNSNKSKKMLGFLFMPL